MLRVTCTSGKARSTSACSRHDAMRTCARLKASATPPATTNHSSRGADRTTTTTDSAMPICPVRSSTSLKQAT
jgi:hypothetical protein